MQQHKGRQYVSVDWRILHGRGVEDRCSGLSEKQTGVGFVRITVAVPNCPHEGEIQHE